MTLETLLKDSAAYNLWAHTRLVNWLKNHPSNLLEREMASSFPTIALTLLHIWGAEKVWHERLCQAPLEPFLSQTFQGTTEEVLQGLLKMSETFANYVEELPEDDFHAYCDFKLLNGTADRRIRSNMIHHCMNHSSYHRGQVVTMARSVGLTDPPQMDYILYVRQKNA